MIRFRKRKGVISMDKKRIVKGGIALLIGLLLTGCAGYYNGYGYYDYPYSDYDYGYYDYGHHREFGERHEWGEHHERGEHHEGSEHH
jgi:hypothetical protein